MKQIELNKQLFDVIKKGNSSRVSQLIRVGADPNATIIPELYAAIDVRTPSHFHDVTPLHYAVMQKDEKMVEVLLKNGADADAAMLFTQGGKRTALDFAVKSKNLKMAKILLPYVLNIDFKVMDSFHGDKRVTWRDGCTALHCAIALGDLAMAVLLIEYGADVNAQVEGNALGQKGIDATYGYTPLHIAVAQGNLDEVSLLLAHGADINIKGGCDRYTPLELAVQKGKIAIAKLIINHIENPEASDQHVNSQRTSSKQQNS